jgi:hypothetical protein
MESWQPKSEQLDRIEVGDVFLTLASWQPEPFFHPSYEIGWQRGERFELIQFRMRKERAWAIVHKLVWKGKDPTIIRNIIDRIEKDTY